MLKKCSKCHQKKQLTEKFYKSNKRKDGSYNYYTYCKDCCNKQRNQYNLQIGKVKTSRGNPVNDLTNKQFGKLTVIKYEGQKLRKNRKRQMWLCQCECGNKKVIQEDNLKSGHTNSCGCLIRLTGNNHYNYKGFNNISGTFWSSIKSSATVRDIEFNITIEYIWELFTQQDNKCVLSGLDIGFANNCEEKNTASLDRIDSTKGYIKGNIQWVHKHINVMKLNHSQDYFIRLCDKVSQNK